MSNVGNRESMSWPLFKNRFWTGNSTCTFPWVMSKVGIPPALSWSMGQKHHQHTHTVATRSEVEEHRQQNNNKASALAFFQDPHQTQYKRKNLYVLLSWISSGSNEEAGMTKQQRLPWDLPDSWSNPRCCPEKIFVGRPHKPTTTILNSFQKPKRLDVIKDNTRERFLGYSRKRFNIKTSPYWLVLDLIYKTKCKSVLEKEKVGKSKQANNINGSGRE